MGWGRLAWGMVAKRAQQFNVSKGLLDAVWQGCLAGAACLVPSWVNVAACLACA